MKNKTVDKVMKIFKCKHNSCDYKTNRNLHLNRHINSMHKNIRNYLCDWPNYGQSFTQNRYLKRHEKFI
jgi:hypothetical protein